MKPKYPSDKLRVLKYLLSMIAVFAFLEGYAQQDSSLLHKNLAPAKMPDAIIGSLKRKGLGGSVKVTLLG